MALRTPVLDDRSYAQLRDELLARIPVYAPEWTDHHPSDPGVTLVELFAFLGEHLLFRFNQLPDATRLAFLDLLDVAVRPAAPAAAMLALTTERTDGVLVELRSRATAGKVLFETLDEVTAWPVEARAVLRVEEEVPVDDESYEYVARASEVLGVSVEDVTTYRTVLATGDPSQPGGDVLDPATSVDGTLWVLVLAAAADQVAAARAGLAGGLLSLGFVPAEEVPAMAEVAACPGSATAPPTPAVEWQVCTTTADPSAADPDTADPVWTRLEVAADGTAGLTATGVVRLQFPDSTADLGLYEPPDADALGAGDQPPLLEDDDLADRAVCWLRAYRPNGGDIGALEWLGANATRVEQAATAEPELLGTGTGQPDQEYRLVNPSVLGDVGLDVEERGAGTTWAPWTAVDDFSASTIDDRHFVVDLATGTVRFGDGVQGRAPGIGERVRVRSYRYGGGAEGNVAAGAITAVPDVPTVKAANPLPARGGAAAETVVEATDRIPGELRRHDRAVTASDFAELALATPGAGIARAESLALFHPAHLDRDVPGAVSVVVWPAQDRRHPSAPQPERSTLDLVCRYLDERRLATTELHVIPPTYRRIAVSVGASVKPGHGSEAVRRWVELLLRQYLAPLPPYGPEGQGWPLGQRVHGPELEAAAVQVEGVQYLEGLELAEEVDGVWVVATTVELKPWEVPELAAITVVAGAPLPAGESPPPASPPGPAVPVRAAREVC